MDSDTKWEKTGRGLYRYDFKKKFVSGGTRLAVVDRINVSHPFESDRSLWIVGTNAYYSMVPLFSFQKKLISFTFCEDILTHYPKNFCRHALVLGCGGAAVPRWLLQNFPHTTVDVVDISPQIIEVCQEYFLNEWKDCDRLHYHCKDASEYTGAKYPFRFVFCDLFDGTNLAPPVCQTYFAQNLRRMMADDGCLVINCGWRHKAQVRHTYSPVFDYVQAIDREPWQTQVLCFSPHPIPELSRKGSV